MTLHEDGGDRPRSSSRSRSGESRSRSRSGGRQRSRSADAGDDDNNGRQSWLPQRPPQPQSQPKSRFQSLSGKLRANMASAKSRNRGRSRSPGRRDDLAARGERKERLMANYDDYERNSAGSRSGGSDEEESVVPRGNDGGGQSRFQRLTRGRGGGGNDNGGAGGGNNGGGGRRGFGFPRRPGRNRAGGDPNSWRNHNQRGNGGRIGGRLPNEDGDEEWGHDSPGNPDDYAAPPGGPGGNFRRSGVSTNFNLSGMSNMSFRRRGTGETSKSKDSQFRAHPFVLPPYLRLAPRIDVWFAFAVASCAAVASIGAVHSQLRGIDSLAFSAGDKFALSTCCISFIFSFFVAVGMRYAPMRTALTKGIMPPSRGRVTRGQQILAGMNLTGELLLLTFLLVFWVISMPIIVNGNAYYNESRDGGVPLAMAGPAIWNANLFYSSWASFLLCLYLWVEVHTLNDRRGTLRVDSPSSSNPNASASLKANNVFTKRWTLLFLASVIVMAASIGIYSSPMCSGKLLKETAYCSRAMMGIIVGGVLQLLVLLAVGVIYRLGNMSPGVLNSQLRNSRNSRIGGSSILSVKKRNTGATAAAVISLVVQSINAGLITSPTGGGPGNISGTLYFSSWLGFVLSFELCLRYLEFHSTSDRPRSRTNLEDVTVYEDEDEEEESMLMLRNGSEDGNQQATRVNLIAAHGEVEDVSDEDEESYVFPGGGALPQDPTLPANAPQEERKSPVLDRRDSPPSIATNQHFGGGMDPDDGSSKYGSVRGNRRSRSPSSKSGPSSGSDPIGSIDARSAPPSRSGDEASKADPEGDAGIGRKWSGHYDQFDDDYGDLRNSDFFNEEFDRMAGAHKNNDPDANKFSNQSSMVLTSFHMAEVEKLDDTHSRGDAGEVVMPPTPGGVGSNLSPLEEGSGEETSPNETSPNLSSDNPPTVEGDPANVAAVQGSGQVGDNLRTMQAMRGTMPQAAATASAERRRHSHSMHSSKSGRSRSREKKKGAGLSNLATGSGSGGKRGSSSGGAQVSRHSNVSRKSGRSRRSQDSAILTEDSGQGGPKKQMSAHGRSRKSAGSRLSGAKSASTMSSKGFSNDGSAILTDDESGSNPPPTISDGMSTKDDLSGFSALSNNKNKNKRPSNASGGPPPPPFRRSNQGSNDRQAVQQDYNDAASQYSSSAPLRSIHTNKGSNGETDTIVSDPTLDAGLQEPESPPEPKPRSSGRGRADREQGHHNSGSTNSYDKKYSDETDVNHSSSEGNPSSREGEGGNRVVDNIVAAALAYAEKTHGEGDSHRGAGRSFHSAAGSQHRPAAAGVPGAQQHGSGRGKAARQMSKNLLRASTATNDDGSSLHSFYTETSSQVGGKKGDKKSRGSSKEKKYTATGAPVDDLVAKALSHAQGQLEGSQNQRKGGSTHSGRAPQQQQGGQPAGRPGMQRQHSSQRWQNAGKSVGSMYSEDDTEFDGQDAGMHFDC